MGKAANLPLLLPTVRPTQPYLPHLHILPPYNCEQTHVRLWRMVRALEFSSGRFKQFGKLLPGGKASAVLGAITQNVYCRVPYDSSRADSTAVYFSVNVSITSCSVNSDMRRFALRQNTSLSRNQRFPAA